MFIIWITNSHHYQWHMFYSEILTSKILKKIKYCLLDLRTNVHWNVVQTISQHLHLCPESWKNARSTFECIIFLPSRGQDRKKSKNYGTNLPPTFNMNQDLVPWIGEEQFIEIMFWHFVQESWYMHLCWKISATTF